jgi:uncharacterized protein YoxC
MPDGTPQPPELDRDFAAAKIEAAFSSWGEAMQGLLENQRLMATKLNELVADRQQQVELIGTLMNQITQLGKLREQDRAAIDALTSAIRLSGKVGNC